MAYDGYGVHAVDPKSHHTAGRLTFEVVVDVFFYPNGKKADQKSTDHNDDISCSLALF